MEELKNLNRTDFEKIRELWLINWHEDSKFSSLQLAEQWVTILIEYLSRKVRHDGTGSKT